MTIHCTCWNGAAKASVSAGNAIVAMLALSEDSPIARERLTRAPLREAGFPTLGACGVKVEISEELGISGSELIARDLVLQSKLRNTQHLHSIRAQNAMSYKRVHATLKA